METYGLTLFYPAAKYGTIKELIDNIANPDIDYILYNDKGRIISESMLPTEDNHNYSNCFLYLTTNDFFVSFNIKLYLSNPKSNFEIRDGNNRLLFKNNVTSFYNIHTKRVYDVFTLGDMQLFFDKVNLLLYVNCEKDYYADNDLEPLITAFTAFNREHGDLYQIDGSDVSLNRRIIKYKLKERPIKKIMLKMKKDKN